MKQVLLTSRVAVIGGALPENSHVEYLSAFPDWCGKPIEVHGPLIKQSTTCRIKSSLKNVAQYLHIHLIQHILGRIHTA